MEIPSVPFEDLKNPDPGEASSTVRKRVEIARKIQMERQGKTNSELGARETERQCRLDDKGENLIRQAMTSLNLSARAYHRVLRVARSIADLEKSAGISRDQLAEAIQYRRFEV